MRGGREGGREERGKEEGKEVRGEMEKERKHSNTVNQGLKSLYCQ